MMRDCTKEELESYVRERGAELTRGVATICDPPVIYWQDPTGTVVARYYVGDERGPEGGWKIADGAK